MNEFSKVLQALDLRLGFENYLEFSQPLTCLDEAT